MDGEVGGVASSPSDEAVAAARGAPPPPPQLGSTWWLPADRVSRGLIPGDLSGRSGHLRGNFGGCLHPRGSISSDLLYR